MEAQSTTQLTLPLLPLTGGVVVPGMVVNLSAETPEAQAAVEAALGADGVLVLVPRNEGRYATVGTVAKIEQVEDVDASSPTRAVLVRGLNRARIETSMSSSTARV